MNSITWQSPPDAIDLKSGEIHIWRAWLNSASEFRAEILTDAEIQRGKRFIRELDQQRFCRARGFLRDILARYLQVDPKTIRFREGSHGKLYLEGEQRLQFNVSHSKELALYALTLDQEVGVDTEWMSPDLEVHPLVQRFFTPEECQAILKLPPGQQLHAFYQQWTRKEAYLKAQGWGLSGLSHPMPKVDAGMIMSLDPAQGYAGAVALTQPNSLIVCQMRYFKNNR
jgi:4'-phosphopantetheinyl transferase